MTLLLLGASARWITACARLIATSGSDCAAVLEAALDYHGHGFAAFNISGDADGRTMSLAKARQQLGWTPAHAAPGP